MYLLLEFSVTLFQCDLDVSFGHEVPVIFRLIEGSGPVHISAQQLVGKQTYKTNCISVHLRLTIF